MNRAHSDPVISPCQQNQGSAVEVGPPTVEDLKALETKAFEAYKNKDGKTSRTCRSTNPQSYGTSVYVRDGGAWKLAFTMNRPAK